MAWEFRALVKGWDDIVFLEDYRSGYCVELRTPERESRIVVMIIDMGLTGP